MRGSCLGCIAIERGYCLGRMVGVAAGLVAVLGTGVLGAQNASAKHTVTDAAVARITRDAILIDTHNDVTSKTVSGYDIATPKRAARPICRG